MDDLIRILLPALAVFILGLCLGALLKRNPNSYGNAKVFIPDTGERISLESGEVSIGRNNQNDIVLTYPTVSRRSLVLQCTKNGWYLKTLKSTAKITVNGKQPEKKRALKSGDKIQIGTQIIIFENN